MPSYTTSLRLVQPATGEYSGTWGTEVNNGLTALVDASIAGTSNITMTAANFTLTSNNGAADQSRAMFLVLGGTPGGSYQVICPAVSKLYFVTNNTGFAQTVKTSAGSGISVPNAARMTLRCDGTDVVAAQNYFASLTLGAALPVNSGGTGLTSYTSGGVVYASSTSALATGSGLVFDGSNLGIGTSSPTYKIDVLSTSTVSGRLKATGALSAFYMEDLGTTAGSLYIGTVGNDWRVVTGSSERFRIDSLGNVQVTLGNLLVGLASPTFGGSQTEIVAGTNKNAFGAKTTQNNYAPLMAWNSATTGDNLFQHFYTEGTLTLRGSIDYNRAGGLVRYNTTSDYRAKDILGPVANPGATIDALKVYEGRMKGATQSRPMLVAHEAQEHAPYAVSGVKDEVNEDDTPKFQQIDVSSLVPLLLAEIQQLRVRVAQLESKA